MLLRRPVPAPPRVDPVLPWADLVWDAVLPGLVGVGGLPSPGPASAALGCWRCSAPTSSRRPRRKRGPPLLLRPLDGSAVFLQVWRRPPVVSSRFSPVFLLQPRSSVGGGHWTGGGSRRLLRWGGRISAWGLLAVFCCNLLVAVTPCGGGPERKLRLATARADDGGTRGVALFLGSVVVGTFSSPWGFSGGNPA